MDALRRSGAADNIFAISDRFAIRLRQLPAESHEQTSGHIMQMSPGVLPYVSAPTLTGPPFPPSFSFTVPTIIYRLLTLSLAIF
ncbi:hypothetical protein Trydic_g14277 [Trypoxylus dichotomus]